MRGLLLLAVCALAEINYAPLFSFSTSLNSSSPDTYYINSFDSISNSCSVSSSLYKYVTFNYTFATAGVKLVNALNTYAVHVAKSSDLSYNISNLCQNGNVWPLEESDATDVSGTLNQYGHYYEANVSYTFFVFASTTSNPVIAEIWDSAYNGMLSITNTSSNITWNPLYTSSQNCQQYSSSYASYFTTKAVTVNASGYYNIFVSFDQNFALPYSYQTPSYPRLAILRGSYSEIEVSNATCDNLGSNYTVGDAGDDSAIAIFAVWLDGNQTYTFVISADENNANVWQGHYGITVAPSSYGQFVATALPPFQRPTRGTCDDTCTSDTTSTRDVPYGVAFFTVPENSQFYLWVSEPGPDLQYYLYKGRNEIGTTGPSTCGLPLQTCIYDADSISGRYFQSGSNTEYTVVATSFYTTSKFPNGNFTAFVISGAAIGSSGSTRAPTASTTAPTSQPNNQTNSTSAPSAPTSRAPTVKGQTYAPTSRNPTAPTAPTSPTVAVANTGALSQPCLFSLFACLAVFKLF